MRKQVSVAVKSEQMACLIDEKRYIVPGSKYVFNCGVC